MNLAFRSLPIFLLGILFGTAAFAQQPNMDNYKPAQSYGPLPNDFILPTVKKYEEQRQQINTNQQEELQKAEDEFYLATNYMVDQMRFSGNVLVNDPMGKYVNKVADKLLETDPELRAKLRFYVMRSPIVNAFTTDQGVIFVTMGLMTRLHNEAELAYVLAHEIIHYKKRHVLKGYIEGVKIKEGIDNYGEMTYENRILKRHSYARSQESQADDEGFDILLKSGYDPHAAIRTFDILALADYPFSDTTFHKSFLENNWLVFPGKYLPDTVKAYKPDEQEEDHDLATHPSVYKRRKAIARRIRNSSDTTGELFLVSKEEFFKVRAMARFEECLMHSNEENYNQSIYATYVMLQYYPGNAYLEKEMVRALYGSVLRKNKIGSFDDLMALLTSILNESEKDDNPLGQQGKERYFNRKADATGWNVAALQYAWSIHRKYPADPDIKLWVDGLFQGLTYANEREPEDFYKDDSLYLKIGNYATEADTGKTKWIKENTPRGRFQAAIDHLSTDTINNADYWRFGLIDLFKDSLFAMQFKSFDKWADSLRTAEEEVNYESNIDRKHRREKEEEQYVTTQGIKKVVAVSPIFMTYDASLETEIDVPASLDGKIMMLKTMQESADRMGMQIEYLDAQTLDSNSIDRFNDQVFANEWFGQRTNFDDGDILPYPQAQMTRMADKYGTDYFLWTAFITSKSPRGGKFFRALTLVLTPIAPHIAYRLFTPRTDMQFLAVVYDIRTGKAVYVQKTELSNQRANPERIRMTIYDCIRQIASPKKSN